MTERAKRMANSRSPGFDGSDGHSIASAVVIERRTASYTATCVKDVRTVIREVFAEY